MRKIYLLLALAVLGLVSVVPEASAQDNVKMMRTNSEGQVSFVRFDTQQKALRTTGKQEVLKQFLPIGANDEMRAVRTERDQLGFEHESLQQFHKGIKVEYGTYRIHSKNGVINAINGDFIPVREVSTSAGISEQDAFNKALAHVGAQQYMWEVTGESVPAAEKVIVKNFRAADKENQKPVLAYKFNVYATQPLSRAYIYVDANTGEIVHENAIIKHATATGTAATRYSGSQTIKTDSYSGSYRLRDYTRGSGIETYDMNESTNYGSAVEFTDNDNNWTSGEYNNAAKDNAALDAHWGAQMTYDYFMTKHNRNSWDGSGAKIKSYVHFDSNYENAYWNGSVMTYGDGDTRFDPLTSLDVAAHEIGHAVCETTANLVYQKESGALNEGFSDIWGASVEYFAAPNKSTWLIGEDIDKQRPSLRSMSNPNAESQPDTYGGNYWINPNCTPSQFNDYCGVHTNSGVLNHWFYLLSVGGSGTNDVGDVYSVTAIGIEDAAKIAYRTEANYLSSNSNYADARAGAIQAAIDLFGDGSDQHIATTNAWYAVNVGEAYGGGGSGSSYCASQGNNASYEWIASVNIGSFSKTSGGATYSDFTSEQVSMAAGSAVSISLSPGFSGSAYNEYWKIYIDYNGDGDFTDAGETAFDAGSMSQTTVTGTINVPSSATGTTRMRVSMKYNGSQSSCEAFSYGEVEDYTVTFTTGGGGTPPPSVEYCDSKGNSVSDEWIDKVVFNGINNVTGANGGYADFTNLVATAGRGGSYSMTVSAGYSGTQYKEYWKIWIDLNQDGDFDDAGELMDEGAVTTAGDVTASVNIPTSATLGTTRMRVSMKYNTAQTSCETFSYGEVEDYSVNITSTPVYGFDNAQTTSSASVDSQLEKGLQSGMLAPNPATDIVRFNLAGLKEDVKVSVFDIQGKVINAVKYNEDSQQMDVSSLKAGLYLIRVETGGSVEVHRLVKK